jgi:hypothetical protein
MGAILSRLRNLPEYRSTSQIQLTLPPPSSATRATLLLSGSGLVGGNAAGTYIGINALTGYTGDILNYQVNGTTLYRMLASGFVGVGTTPVSALHVSSSGGGLTVDRVAESAFAPSVQIRKARGSLGAEATLQNADTMGQVLFSGHDGTTYRTTGVLRAMVEGVPALNNIPTRLEVQTGAAGVTTRQTWDTLGNVVIGTTALGTTATAGFPYIPSCPGTPTGVPTAYTGRVPMVYDTTANKLWFYNGSWRGVVVA